MSQHEHPQPGELPAGFTTETCIVVACRTCGHQFDEDEEGVIHFPNLDDAADTVTRAGWWVTQQGAQCRGCAADEACASFGHAWPREWTLCRCNGRIPVHVQQMEYRNCACCDEHQERIAQPVGGA